MMKYGYARVSSSDQNESRQLVALLDIGIKREQIYVDKASGKDFNRKDYQKMLKKLEPGDELYIVSIDRLGRNYDQILSQWRYLTKKKKISIIVLDMPLLDTRSVNDLTGILISDFVLQILSYVAQKEREFINKRQQEGIALARKNGVKFGRRPKEMPENIMSVVFQYDKKSINSRQAAELLGVCHKTFMKWYHIINGDKSTPLSPFL